MNKTFLLGILFLSSWLNAQTFDFNCFIYEDTGFIVQARYTGQQIIDIDTLEDTGILKLDILRIAGSQFLVTLITTEITGISTTIQFCNCFRGQNNINDIEIGDIIYKKIHK